MKLTRKKNFLSKKSSRKLEKIGNPIFDFELEKLRLLKKTKIISLQFWGFKRSLTQLMIGENINDRFIMEIRSKF